MIEVETLQFIGMLNRLQMKLNKGCMEFSECNDMEFDGILYDAGRPLDMDKYPVIDGRHIDKDRHDILSWYGDEFDGVTVALCMKDGQADSILVDYECPWSTDEAHITITGNGWYT